MCISGCSVKRLTYGYNGIPTSCYRHRKQDMVKISLTCHSAGCNVKTLNYNFEGLNYGVSCGKHASKGMVNFMKPDPLPKHDPPVEPDQKEVSIYWPNKQPSQWLLERVFLSSMQADISQEVFDLNYIYGHVGGRPGSSPPRGVTVIGNCNGDVEKTWWTASQNQSNVTLESKTVPYPPLIQKCLPFLKEELKSHFPEAPISDQTYALAVANHYCSPLHRISPHTDAQPWYADPPVFASVTVFKQQPRDWRSTHRFQVFDESSKTWIDLFLPHLSVCTMRADIKHRVLPPLKKFSPHVERWNLTFRNLVPKHLDPLGFILAMSNHYRYYGIPKTIYYSTGQELNNDLLQMYRKINPDITICQRDLDLLSTKKLLREQVSELYRERGLSLNHRMMGKSNVVVECLMYTLKQ